MDSYTINGLTLEPDGSVSGSFNPTTTYSAGAMEEQVLAMIMGFFGVMFAILLVLAILTIIGKWKVFVKAGKPGWHAIIPFLNTYDLYEIGGQKGVYFLFAFIPFVGALISSVFTFLAYYNITRAFNKSKWYLVGLTIIPFIFYLILGFSNDQFDRQRVIDDESEMANQPITQTRAA